MATIPDVEPEQGWTGYERRERSGESHFGWDENLQMLWIEVPLETNPAWLAYAEFLTASRGFSLLQFENLTVQLVPLSETSDRRGVAGCPYRSPVSKRTSVSRRPGFGTQGLGFTAGEFDTASSRT